MALISRFVSLFTRSLKIVTLTTQSKQIHRWVAPTLMEFKRREDKLGGKKINPRNTFIEWNLEAEVYAFGKRLNEDFDSDLLLQAFTDRSYVIKEELKQQEMEFEVKMKDNRELAQEGEKFITEYIQAYLEAVLPKFPVEGLKKINEHLTSTDSLAHISSHLGTKDVILAVEYPVDNLTLATAFKAVVGALLQSSGGETAAHFVRDFVITQLQALSHLMNEVEDGNTLDLETLTLKDSCRKTLRGILHFPLPAPTQAIPTFEYYEVWLWVAGTAASVAFALVAKMMETTQDAPVVLLCPYDRWDQISVPLIHKATIASIDQILRGTENQGQDVNDYWQIDNPWAMLTSIIEKDGAKVEPRLIGEAGKHTLLACYRVGLYVDKQMISSGFGESVGVAKEMAAREALKKVFGTEDHMKPIDFKVEGIPKATPHHRFQITAS